MTKDVISFRRYRRSLHRPLRSGFQRIHHREGLLVTLRGHTLDGSGEAAPAGWVGGEPLDSLEPKLETLTRSLARNRPPILAALLGPRAEAELTIDAVGPLVRELRKVCPEELGPSAYGALETAALDLAGQILDRPVFAILPQQRSLPERPPPLPLVASLVHLVASETREAIDREIQEAVQTGYRHFKLKVGGRDLHHDVERVQAIVQSGDPLIQLRLDANRSWSPKQADQFLERINPGRISCLEEPLARPISHELCTLRERHAVRLALDESILDREDLERAAATRACDIIVLKLARLGGPVRTTELASHAMAAGLDVIVTDSLETEIGQAAALHTAMAIHGPKRAVGLAGASLFETNLSERAQRTVQGPGLGLSNQRGTGIR